MEGPFGRPLWKVGDALPVGAAFSRGFVKADDCDYGEFLPVASAVVSMSAFSSRASVAAKKAAQELEILFTLESVGLKGKTATVKPPAQIQIEVDMPGEESEMTKTPSVSVKVGTAKLNNYIARYNVSQESVIRSSLVEALQSENEEDSEVLFNLIAVNDKKGGTTLGYGSVKLERLLATGADYKSKAIPVKDRDEVLIAELKLSTTCLAAMQGVEKEVQSKLAESALAKAKKDKQCILLDVASVSLKDLPAKSRPTAAVLKAELIGVKSTKPVEGPEVPLADGEAELEFDAPFIIPPGSQLRAEAEAARAKGTLKLKLSVVPIVKGKQGKEIGSGEIDLSGSIANVKAAEEDDEVCELKGPMVKGVSPKIGEIIYGFESTSGLLEQMDREKTRIKVSSKSSGSTRIQHTAASSSSTHTAAAHDNRRIPHSPRTTPSLFLPPTGRTARLSREAQSSRVHLRCAQARLSR